MGMKTAKDDNSFAAAALEASEKARARSMLEDLTLSKANFTADADPAAVKAESEIRISLNAKSDQLTELLSAGGDNAEIERLDADISELQNSLAVILADLKQKSPIYSAIKDPPPFDVAAFQSQVLDDNSILLEYSLGTDESYLWAVGNRSFDSFVLPPRPGSNRGSKNSVLCWVMIRCGPAKRSTPFKSVLARPRPSTLSNRVL